jgi:hypothetical protein
MVYAGDIISSCFTKTKELFFPIRKEYWIKMGLVSMTGGSDNGGNISNMFNGYNGNSGNNNTQSEINFRELVIKFNSEALNFMASYGYIVYSIIAIVYVICLIFSYITSIMNFVFIDGIINKEIKIRKSFSENKPIGSSLFVLRFYLGIIVLAGTLACLYPLILAFFKNRLADFNLWLLIPMIVGFIALSIILGIAGFIVNDFLIPLMHSKKCSYSVAFEHFKKISENKKGEIILYWLLKIALSIAAGLLSLIMIIPIILIGIIAILVGILLYYLLNAALGQIVAIITLIALGIIVLLFLIFAVGILYVPVPVFFRIYSIEMVRKLEENMKQVKPLART